MLKILFRMSTKFKSNDIFVNFLRPVFSDKVIKKIYIIMNSL